VRPLPAHADITCAVSTKGIAFGSYNTFSLANNDSTGNVSVTCTPTAQGSVSYTAGLSSDNGSSASWQTTSGTNSLNCSVCVDTTR
jgi:spore coat protein U-like protein